MHDRPPHDHPTPRAGLRARHDPIDTPERALALVAAAAAWPLRDQIIAVALDADRCGGGILVVDHTIDDDAILATAEVIAGARAVRGIDGVILTSIRPARSVADADGQRWHRCSTLLADAGTELVEWFVVGRRISLPRALVNDPPRWRSGRVTRRRHADDDAPAG